MIYAIYAIITIITWIYFYRLLEVKPWNRRSSNIKFRYRIKRYTKTYLNKDKITKSYIIFRKFGYLSPWFDVSIKFSSAEDASKALYRLMLKDKEKSCKKKEKWLNNGEFLAEAL